MKRAVKEAWVDGRLFPYLITASPYRGPSLSKKAIQLADFLSTGSRPVRYYSLLSETGIGWRKVV